MLPPTPTTRRSEASSSSRGIVPSSIVATMMLLLLAMTTTTTMTTVLLLLLPRPTLGLLLLRPSVGRQQVDDCTRRANGVLRPMPMSHPAFLSPNDVDRARGSRLASSSSSSARRPDGTTAASESHPATTHRGGGGGWRPSFPSPSDREAHFRNERRRRHRGAATGGGGGGGGGGGEERLGTLGFHHVEFYVGDALTTARRFESALGMPITCWSSLATGNDVCVTYGLECFGNYDDDDDVDDDDVDDEPGEGVRFLFTAPLGRRRTTTGTIASSSSSSSSSSSKSTTTGKGGVDDGPRATAPLPMPGYDPDAAREFVVAHGMAVKAVGVEVTDAIGAYDMAVGNGARGVLAPTAIRDHNNDDRDDDDDDAEEEEEGGERRRRRRGGTTCRVAEVALYGDVVLRFVSFHRDDISRDDDRPPAGSSSSSDGGVSSDHRRRRLRTPSPFLPCLSPYPNNDVSGRGRPRTYGLARIDHAVGNVPDLLEALEYVRGLTGYHLFAEFAAEDVGTLDSGLNSVVLASDNEAVLLPLNEPTEGRRKSQIQTYLEQNDGPGLQHIAIKSYDIFETIRHMRHAEKDLGGFELMARPSDRYYRELPSRLGDRLSAEQYERLEELGILADADDEGVLLQIFTKPLGDRPTLFLEIIQRIGCVLVDADDDDDDAPGSERRDGGGGRSVRKKRNVTERPGCGGFGQGNFRELFKSIEDFEKTLKV